MIASCWCLASPRKYADFACSALLNGVRLIRCRAARIVLVVLVGGLASDVIFNVYLHVFNGKSPCLVERWIPCTPPLLHIGDYCRQER